MFALFFSAASDKHILFHPPLKFYGPAGLGEKLVCWMLCVPPLLTFRHVISTLERVLGRCRKQIAVVSSTSCIALTSRALFVGVCVGVCLGGESMIRLLILACLLSKAAWIEETVGHNWLRQLGHDHSPRVEHSKANLHVTLPNYTKKRTKNSERKDILLLLPPTFSFSVYQVSFFFFIPPCLVNCNLYTA